jgi:hypothetical protein
MSGIPDDGGIVADDFGGSTIVKLGILPNEPGTDSLRRFIAQKELNDPVRVGESACHGRRWPVLASRPSANFPGVVRTGHKGRQLLPEQLLERGSHDLQRRWRIARGRVTLF